MSNGISSGMGTGGIPTTDNIPETTEKLRCPTDNIPDNRNIRVSVVGIPPVPVPIPIPEEIQLLMYGTNVWLKEIIKEILALE